MSVHQQLSAQFYEWEMRGRGWKVWLEPVAPEPPFRTLTYALPEAVDDGRRPSFFGSLLRQLVGNRQPEPGPPVLPQADDDEVIPLVRGELIELEATIPAKLDLSKDAYEPFLTNISSVRGPIAFELVGLPGRVSVQFVVDPSDALQVRRQLNAYFPEAVFQSRGSKLEELWYLSEGNESLVVEFGLAREFLLPLASGKLDPFIGLLGALAGLEQGEMGLFQVIFQSVESPWAASMTDAVSLPEGSALFVNARELTEAAEKKASRPLFAAVLRLGVKSAHYDRTLEIARDMAASLRVFAHPEGNELIPLTNDEYPFEEHVEDLLRRQTRRSGMIISCDELFGFVHLPSSAVRSTALVRQTAKTKAAPNQVTKISGVCLGLNSHLGQTVQVYLSPEERVRHVHIVGASGTGKSTLLFNLIRQDIENGQGLGVLDPHGDLIDRILGIIPRERISDVVLLDASDEEYSVGFNILSAHSDLEKNLLASDLVSVFERLSTSWGDQMASVLNNAIRAFLESSTGGTLADMRRFLLEPRFRDRFLETVLDPDIVYYWQKGFTQLSGNKSIGPVLTRLETFLSPKPIRYMVSQKENRLDFGRILDSGKIFLAKLPQGAIGRENSFLLGSLIVAKLQQTAMSRQRQAADLRRDFWLYLDEFHNFITPSMAEILNGARKYRLGLVLAHQELRQLQRNQEVASAVLSNPYSRVCFRVGDDDARKLADGFSFFEARDIQNLGTGEAVCRVERSDFDFNLTVPFPTEPSEQEARERLREIVEASRRSYATPRGDVEAMLYKNVEKEPIPQPKPSRESEKPVTPAASKETPPIISTRPVESKPPTSEPITREPVEDKLQEALKKRIGDHAESLDYTVTPEERVLGGPRRIDLVLRRGKRVIACEVSATNTVQYEAGKNVAKCLEAGFRQVVMVCHSKTKLARIQQAVIDSIPSEQVACVSFYLPDEFLARLLDWAAEDPDGAVLERGKPRKKRTVLDVGAMSENERKERERAGLRQLAETMKRKPPA